MSRSDTAVLIVDVQEKLIRFIQEHDRLIWNLGRLLDAAGLFHMPILATEQYPQGLGSTVDAVACKLPSVSEKVRFSCGGCPELFSQLAAEGREKILVAGIETHVCIQQTVLDLLADGFSVFVPADAVGSRSRIDHDTALRRMESAGAIITTTESALFEWCEQAGTQEFKRISELVRQSPPA
jgi:nicotinamidase-related amidase